MLSPSRLGIVSINIYHPNAAWNTHMAIWAGRECVQSRLNILLPCVSFGPTHNVDTVKMMMQFVLKNGQIAKLLPERYSYRFAIVLTRLIAYTCWQKISCGR